MRKTKSVLLRTTAAALLGAAEAPTSGRRTPVDKSRVRTPVVVGVLCVLAWAIGDKISYQVRAIVRGGGTAGIRTGCGDSR